MNTKNPYDYTPNGQEMSYTINPEEAGEIRALYEQAQGGGIITFQRVNDPQTAASSHKAAIYIRAATCQIRERTMLVNLIEQCKAYCVQRGYALRLILQEIGFAGSSCDRPGLHTLCEAARLQMIDKIVTPSFDQISRDPIYATDVVSELMQYGVTVECVDSHNLDDSQFIEAMLQFVAQTEHEMILERMKHGKAVKRVQYGQ